MEILGTQPKKETFKEKKTRLAKEKSERGLSPENLLSKLAKEETSNNFTTVGGGK